MISVTQSCLGQNFRHPKIEQKGGASQAFFANIKKHAILWSQTAVFFEISTVLKSGFALHPHGLRPSDVV